MTAAQAVSDSARAQFELYTRLRALRETQNDDPQLIDHILHNDALDWLIKFEAYEISQSEALKQQLNDIAASSSDDVRVLIEGGLQRLAAEKT